MFRGVFISYSNQGSAFVGNGMDVTIDRVVLMNCKEAQACNHPISYDSMYLSYVYLSYDRRGHFDCITIRIHTYIHTYSGHTSFALYIVKYLL